MKNNNRFKTRHLHNPDVLDTDKESIFDMHEDMKTVDAIPVEDLNEQVKDERDKNNTKHTSSSEKRYE
ncbi:hypothetical protein [Bacillus ndiopicus]|uniref:hypothetical protein n=1 Tax=Bacillus ndiopicus TaxID=1347368 RepID=UPI0005A8E3FC|nr:hypothetical protein [Bacillus ndiopicus]